MTNKATQPYAMRGVVLHMIRNAPALLTLTLALLVVSVAAPAIAGPLPATATSALTAR